eukprot:scaffold271655_cov14-Prasinocladus_malaysianus.AAC.1
MAPVRNRARLPIIKRFMQKPSQRIAKAPPNIISAVGLQGENNTPWHNNEYDMIYKLKKYFLYAISYDAARAAGGVDGRFCVIARRGVKGRVKGTPTRGPDLCLDA